LEFSNAVRVEKTRTMDASVGKTSLMIHTTVLLQYLYFTDGQTKWYENIMLSTLVHADTRWNGSIQI